MRHLKGAAALSLAVGLAVLAQVQHSTQRTNGNPILALTTAAPTVNPFPATRADMTKGSVTGQAQAVGLTSGQSNSVPGALHLDTCGWAQCTICGDGGTLSGAGFVDYYTWPEWAGDAGTANLWSVELTDSITVAAGTQCQPLPAHQSTGMDWLFPAARSVTTSAGTAVNIDCRASCAY